MHSVIRIPITLCRGWFWVLLFFFFSRSLGSSPWHLNVQWNLEGSCKRLRLLLLRLLAAQVEFE